MRRSGSLLLPHDHARPLERRGAGPIGPWTVLVAQIRPSHDSHVAPVADHRKGTRDVPLATDASTPGRRTRSLGPDEDRVGVTVPGPRVPSPGHRARTPRAPVRRRPECRSEGATQTPSGDRRGTPPRGPRPTRRRPAAPCRAASNPRTPVAPTARLRCRGRGLSSGRPQPRREPGSSLRARATRASLDGAAARSSSEGAAHNASTAAQPPRRRAQFTRWMPST